MKVPHWALARGVKSVSSKVRTKAKGVSGTESGERMETSSAPQDRGLCSIHA
jgi:hypothetical protein